MQLSINTLSITLLLRRHGGLIVSPFTPDQAVWVRALAWGTVLCCWAGILCFHGASLHEGVQMGKGEFNAQGNPALD